MITMMLNIGCRVEYGKRLYNMKKLVLEIPEWRGDRSIYVFFDREIFAVEKPDGTLYVKTVRCTFCGKCCQNPGPAFPEYIPEGETEKYCAHCEKDGDRWICMNPAFPFGCVRENGDTLPHPDCIMEYDKKS